MTTKLIENRPKQGMIIDQFNSMIAEYVDIFLLARIKMEEIKAQEWTLSLEKLTEIFFEFSIKKNEMINYYSSLSSELAKEYLAFLSNKFTTSSWPEKRCVWEVIAGINNYIFNNYKV